MKEKILVVDDEKVILQLTSMILRNRGFEVLTAESGNEGLEVLEREPVPLVLLDYMMPVMDGMTALKIIRERFPATYVIMFTGKGSEEIAVELMKAGACDYVLKPFNNQDLLDRIENALRIRRIELHNKELREEIELWNQELERRVSEKSAELDRAQMEVVQAEKLAAFGHLSAGMAHEIRNPLNSISLFAQILQSGLSPESELYEYPEKIIKEVDRIDGLLRKLLDASKRPHLDLQKVDLVQEVSRALDLFAPQIKMQGVEVRTEIASDAPLIDADAHEIAQIFNNLIVNALYEMPQGGCLKIALRHDDALIYVDVSDSGQGIPEDNLYRVFDPFFTTKDRGTGLGLSVVLRIVKGYGGRISVDSAPGHGTTFRIQLPLVSA